MNGFIQVPPDNPGGKKLVHRVHGTGDSTTFAPVHHLADPVHPDRQQIVTARGAALMAFSEGEPALDAFSNLRVGEAHAIGYYDFVTDGQADLFWDRVTGTGSINYVAGGSYTLLSVGSAAAVAIRSTTRYHFYQPGVSNLIIQTLALSDTGRDNNCRTWGYGDAGNAMCWELEGADDGLLSNLSVVVRSDSTGVVTENRVHRADWNCDRLDGTGTSGYDIDVTGRQYYWIDFAWLGAGPVRFGVLGPKGERILCHVFNHAGTGSVPYVRFPSLPVFWSNVNTGPTSGSSELRVFCAAVYATAALNYNYWRFSDMESPLKTVTTRTPLVSIRPTLTLESGEVNRVGLYPDRISVFVKGGTIRLDLYEDAELVGDTWTLVGGGTCEGDTGATAATAQAPFASWYLDAGAHNLDVASIYETNDEGYHVYGDGLSAQTLSVVATVVDGSTVQCCATVAYRELR